jgi:RsiW-degrading membrane proteinase PrsW (M82 family)
MKYRYIIYKIYSWSVSKSGETPVANTILTLATVHFFQFAILLLFIDQVITPIRWIYDINKIYLFIGALVYFVLFYFLVYNKKRWASYIDEFKNENERDRKKGNILVISFLIGSILLFFISLPVLSTLGRMKGQ